MSAERRRLLLGAGAIVLVVLVLYGRTVMFDSFVYDDGLNITKNPHVNQGVTWEGLRVALMEGMNQFWFPVTALSHMVEVSVFGVNPHAMHAVNVLLHAMNCVLVLLLFRGWVGWWPGMFAALLYAAHPLAAEPTAWISGRRDLLCALFWLLALLAYGRHSAAPSVGRMLLVALLFVLGMASKVNMIALLPILLVLDGRPYGRFELDASITKRAQGAVLEKIPLGLVGIWLASLTMRLQAAMFDANLEQVPFVVRLFNAVYIYAFYVVKLFVPTGLVVQYPYLDQGPSMVQLLGAVLLLGAITVGCVVMVRRMPLLLVGWVWYVVAMLPAAGLTRVADFLTADRYVYIPMLGLLLMAAAMLQALLEARPALARPAAAAAGVVVMVFACMAFVQGGYWRDNITLWTRTMSQYPDAPFSINGYGAALYEAGRLDEARAVLEMGRAMGGKKQHMFDINLTDIAIVQGRWADGIAHVRAVHQVTPWYQQGYLQLADILEGAAAGMADAAQRGKLERERRIALLQARIVAGESPAPSGEDGARELAEAYGHLAASFAKAGRLDVALQYCAAAWKADPANPHYPHLAGRICLQMGNEAHAREFFSEALRVDGDYAPALEDMRKMGEG